LYRSKIIDVLINNAAQGESGSLAEVDIDTVRRLFEVNVFSTLELTQIVIKGMVERDGGSVIFISSIAGRVPVPFLMPYSMTKFAISAAAAGLRKEMEVLGKGIHVSVVEPGPYKTGFNQRLNDSRFEWMEQDSLFSREQVEKMKASAATELRLAEMESTDSIVRTIVSAAEAGNPKLRYVAPWHFAMLVPYAGELWGAHGVMPDATLSPTHLFPNLLRRCTTDAGVTAAEMLPCSHVHSAPLAGLAGQPKLPSMDARSGRPRTATLGRSSSRAHW